MFSDPAVRRLNRTGQWLNAYSGWIPTTYIYGMKKIIFYSGLLIACIAGNQVFGQEKSAAGKTDSVVDKKAAFNKMLALSGPGKEHEVLARLAGTWAFQDAKLAFVKGTLVRKPMFEGRFYTVEITGGKLMIPVANGQMKEANYQGMQIEGYDNVKAAYVTTSMNNHIGSDIEFQIGSFDAGKNAFTYEWEEELLPGAKTKNRRVLTIKDADHYAEEYFELRNGEWAKVRELDYARSAH